MEDIKQKHTQLFLYLLSSFEMSALAQMGKIKNPATDKVERDLFQAQLSIDIIDMMKEKTKGNLSEDEQKILDNMIAQLKLNYVDELEKDKKEKDLAAKSDAAQQNKNEEKSEG